MAVVYAKLILVFNLLIIFFFMIFFSIGLDNGFLVYNFLSIYLEIWFYYSKKYFSNLIAVNFDSFFNY